MKDYCLVCWSLELKHPNHWKVCLVWLGRYVWTVSQTESRTAVYFDVKHAIMLGIVWSIVVIIIFFSCGEGSVSHCSDVICSLFANSAVSILFYMLFEITNICWKWLQLGEFFNCWGAKMVVLNLKGSF